MQYVQGGVFPPPPEVRLESPPPTISSLELNSVADAFACSPEGVALLLQRSGGTPPEPHEEPVEESDAVDRSQAAQGVRDGSAAAEFSAQCGDAVTEVDTDALLDAEAGTAVTPSEEAWRSVLRGHDLEEETEKEEQHKRDHGISEMAEGSGERAAKARWWRYAFREIYRNRTPGEFPPADPTSHRFAPRYPSPHGSLLARHVRCRT